MAAPVEWRLLATKRQGGDRVRGRSGIDLERIPHRGTSRKDRQEQGGQAQLHPAYLTQRGNSATEEVVRKPAVGAKVRMQA
jgi:hypothetical protein